MEVRSRLRVMRIEPNAGEDVELMEIRYKTSHSIHRNIVAKNDVRLHMNSAAQQGRQKTMTQLMNRRLFFVLSCAWLAFALTSVAETAPRVHHVFIISFDQGNPDLIEKSQMPLFHQMVAEGAHTWEAYTIVPSLTLPSHTSMLTGVGVQKHQVLWNDYEPDKGFVKTPTIFSIAKEHGLVTAMFVGKEKFKHLDVPGSVDVFVWPQPEDDAKSVAKAFAAAVGQLKPNVCFIHFRDPDSGRPQIRRRIAGKSPGPEGLRRCSRDNQRLNRRRWNS